ncbi:unnamed protein product, partial [Staurois parvus]
MNCRPTPGGPDACRPALGVFVPMPVLPPRWGPVPVSPARGPGACRPARGPGAVAPASGPAVPVLCPARGPGACRPRPGSPVPVAQPWCPSCLLLLPGSPDVALPGVPARCASARSPARCASARS